MARHARSVLVSFNDDPTRLESGPASARLAVLAEHLGATGELLALVTRPVTGGGTSAAPRGVVRLPLATGPPDDFDHLRRLLPSLVEHLVDLFRQHATVDVVIAHGWAGAVAAHAACRGTRIRLVTMVDDQPPGEKAPPGAALARLEASVAGASAAVLTGNSAVATQLVRRGVARRRIHPLAMPLLAPEVASPPRHARSGSRVAVLTARHDRTDTGLAGALRAVSHIDGAEPVVVPSPPLHREAWADYWSGPGRALDEAAVVVHVPTFVPDGHEAVAAMSRGAPLVASATGAHVDIVEDSVNGRLVPAHATAEIVCGVRELLDDQFSASALGVAAHDRIHQRHSVDRVAADFGRVMDLVADLDGSGAAEADQREEGGVGRDEDEDTMTQTGLTGRAMTRPPNGGDDRVPTRQDSGERHR